MNKTKVAINFSRINHGKNVWWRGVKEKLSTIIFCLKKKKHFVIEGKYRELFEFTTLEFFYVSYFALYFLTIIL